MDFSKRSYKKELLDAEDIPFEDIRQNMKELDFINKYLGGHKITIEGLKQLLRNKNQPNDHVHIMEIGCGGGDNLRVLKKYCKLKNISASFTGIDINPHCINFAKSRSENKSICFIESDYKKVMIPGKPTIIFSSLFCHHFTNEELVSQFCWMKKNSATGFFINDLHRQSLAYYSIKWLTKIFSKSYLVKNDAPLSVLRGFSKKELDELLNASVKNNYTVSWKWAFRWLVVCNNG